MKWIAFLIVTIICTTLCAMSQPDQYSIQTTGSAPTPVSPSSPVALGLQAPSVTSSPQPPSPQERSQNLMKVDQQMAYSAPSDFGATATGPTYTQMIVPSGGTGNAPNSLYISYAPKTVISCNLYASLPMWLLTSSTGNVYFYEWYPNGLLDTNYAGNIYSPGWYKRWFFADVPGWHILQYYCTGWSNYAYIYVYGPDYWANPKPVPNPEKSKCERNPWCHWVNGKCLCTGVIPPKDTHATGLIIPYATGLIIPDSEPSGHTHATGLIIPDSEPSGHIHATGLIPS
ncbi:MAG: hypothetical protein LUQ38_08625 [Methanotrichaceae archaeon]|nr:hypothetical protein [Methanotrichaceae archaeon]